MALIELATTIQGTSDAKALGGIKMSLSAKLKGVSTNMKDSEKAKAETKG